MENKNDLRRLHNIQLEMALVVKDICIKNDIKYSIIAGTILGAVRHKGFIPWDDDLDIGLLRSDYDKFLEVCKTDLPHSYFLQTWDTDCYFGLPFAKLRKIGTEFIEPGIVKSKMHKEIFIDIFPIDNIPNRKTEQFYQNIYTYFLKRLVLIKLGYILWNQNQYIKRGVYFVLFWVANLLEINMLKNEFNKQMRKYNNESTQNVTIFGGSYGYRKETFKRELILCLTDLEFENNTLSAFKDFDTYLANLYGNYMELPPLEKRKLRHGIAKFNDNE
jgi:lipopolysaccharide cholinephosphotransferase